MLFYVLTYLAGALTIVSPCILPVLPFVFTRVGRPFLSHTLPMLVGMALMFAVIASLASLGGAWVVATNHAGRVAALVLLAGFGLMLAFPALAERASRPFVQLGWNWSQKAGQAGAGRPSGGWAGALLLGVATGLLWAPCAGPILGLVLTGAALKGGGLTTSLLLLSYGAGAATSLALALLVGGRVFAAMKRSLGFSEHLRRVLGVLVLLAVVAIAAGLDTGALARLSLAQTSRIEEKLLARFGMTPARPAPPADGALADLGPAPPLAGATLWLNGPAPDPAQLRGKVVLVDFWTYSCINCLRTLPYVRAWAEKYRAAGLVVIGVHTPEFAFEKEPGNVRAALGRLGITYPVALDNNYAIWQAFGNQYWPAHYLIDTNGHVRAQQFGEGDEAGFERLIQQLLAEGKTGGMQAVPGGVVADGASGIEAARSGSEQSPETYLGYGRAERFASTPAARHDAPARYRLPALAADQWGLEGDWTVSSESARLEQAGGRIAYRFRARDLHLVLGPGATGRPVRFRVTIDGHAPGEDHGMDTDAAGSGTLREQRLYQLVRLHDGAGEHTFTIEFLDAGATAFAFTFG